VTVLSAIHDLNMAALYCGRIYVLKTGRIVLHGTPEEVLSRNPDVILIHDYGFPFRRKAFSVFWRKKGGRRKRRMNNCWSIQKNAGI